MIKYSCIKFIDDIKPIQNILMEAEMLRVGICDEDERFVVKLEHDLIEYAQKENILIEVDILKNSKELFNIIENDGLFNILFLDVELEKNAGIKIGKKIRSNIKNEIMQIIFVSSKDDYAMSLFDIRPMNFLIKPVNNKKVNFVLNEYRRLYEFQNIYFKYNIGKREYQISNQCIVYFQSQGKKIRMVTLDGTENFYEKLSQVMQRLNSNYFFEIHKSYIVNMRYITRYQKDSITMVNGDIIPISRARQKTVEQKILGSDFKI